MIQLIDNLSNSTAEERSTPPAKSPGSVDISVQNLSRTFGKRKALDDVNLSIRSGEIVSLIGPSGAGKSTLLRSVAGLIRADCTSGDVSVGGRIVQTRGRISSRVRSIRSEIGFIFQQFNLVNRLSLLTNVLTGHLASMPVHRRVLRLFTTQEKRIAMHALSKVGLQEYATQRADTLSGGQQQRASVARAMVQGAGIILADEPVASLDPESARLVLTSLRDLNQRLGLTVVISIHQIELAKQYTDRLIGLKDGKVCCDCAAIDITVPQINDLYQRQSA